VQYPLATGEALTQALIGKTLVYGDSATGGPYRFRLNADGNTVFLRGRELTEFDTVHELQSRTDRPETQP
jgi:hypothetical protein